MMSRSPTNSWRRRLRNLQGRSVTSRSCLRKSNVSWHSLIISAEFSSFSKNFSEKAPKPKAGLRDFLSMFDSQKSDPSKSHHDSKNEDDDTVVAKDYLKYEKGGILKVEGYYVNKIAHIKGNLVFSKQYLKFEPNHCPENEPVSNHILILVGEGLTEQFPSNNRLPRYC
jgi:hypothetical protein